MASGKVKLEKVLGFGIDAEVPSWSEFSALRRKLEELQQVVTAGKSELESSLASTDRHLNDVIDSHNELERTTGQLSEQISRLAESQESLEKYRERIAQNIASEITPLIEGQINRFYGVSKEIADHAERTRNWLSETAQSCLDGFQKDLQVAEAKIGALSKDCSDFQQYLKQVEVEAGKLLKETTTASARVQEISDYALAGITKQAQSLFETESDKIQTQTEEFLKSLQKSREDFQSDSKDFSFFLDEIRQRNADVKKLFDDIQSSLGSGIAFFETSERLNKRSWQGFWDRLVWLTLGIPPKTDQ